LDLVFVSRLDPLSTHVIMKKETLNSNGNQRSIISRWDTY